MSGSINIVIVTYNNESLLKSCIKTALESLGTSGIRGRVTVVDNASSDGSARMVTAEFPSIRYLRNNKNFGLAKALNIGIREGFNTLYTLLLNDDVELFPDTISVMIDTLREFEEASGIPANLMYPDGSPQRVKLKIIGAYKKAVKNTRYINFAGTTACLYRTEVFKKLGLFDEFYFFYNEDLDLSVRAKRKDIKFVFNPEIRVIHHRKKGRVKAERTIKPYFYATDYYFYRKNFGILFGSIYLIMIIFKGSI